MSSASDPQGAAVRRLQHMLHQAKSLKDLSDVKKRVEEFLADHPNNEEARLLRKRVIVGLADEPTQPTALELPE